MKIYAVTVDGERCNLIGIYAARSLNELYHLIDEVADPNDVLYAEIGGPGGCVWSRDNHEPVAEGDPTPDPENLTGQWADTVDNVMRGADDLNWSRLPDQVLKDSLNEEALIKSLKGTSCASP